MSKEGGMMRDRGREMGERAMEKEKERQRDRTKDREREREWTTPSRAYHPITLQFKHMQIRRISFICCAN